jgi:hypothetical protein
VSPAELESRRVAVERGLRERFHFDVWLGGLDANDRRFHVSVRLPGTVEPRCLTPAIRQSAFEQRTVPQLIAVASAIIEHAQQASLGSDPLDAALDPDETEETDASP